MKNKDSFSVLLRREEIEQIIKALEDTDTNSELSEDLKMVLAGVL